MTTVVRKEDWGVVVASGSGEVILLFPLTPFYFSVSDSCSILSSSSSSCFLILSSSAWACAESSIARRRSVSGLEAEVDLAGLEVSPYSTSTPSGILLEWHWQEKVRFSVALIQEVLRYTAFRESLLEKPAAGTVPFTTNNYRISISATCVPTCHSGFLALDHWSPHQHHSKSPPTMTQTSDAFKECCTLQYRRKWQEQICARWAD